jgi:hypothetical protein
MPAASLVVVRVSSDGAEAEVDVAQDRVSVIALDVLTEALG